MQVKPRTDAEFSVRSDEFVWDSDQSTAIHALVERPIVDRLRRHGAKHVLDLGSGNGAFSGLLKSAGFDVTGLEHSRSGVVAAQRRFPDIAFEQYDIGTPLPASHHHRYDAVVSVEVLEHLLLPRRLLEAAVLALRPRGLIVLTTPYHGYLKNLAIALTNGFDRHWHPLRDFGHVKFFSRDTLLALLNEFRLERIEYGTVGRIPPLACSMIASGTLPK